jgi:hypothetical protein
MRFIGAQPPLGLVTIYRFQFFKRSHKSKNVFPIAGVHNSKIEGGTGAP